MEYPSFMSSFAQILPLLKAAPLPAGDVLPPGVPPDIARAAAKRLGVDFPDALIEWLNICNGPLLGAGGLFGVNPSRADLDIGAILKLFPEWVSRNWIPVGGDGCGNYYVMAPLSENSIPVGFVEASDPEQIAYVVASSLPKFIEAYLLEEVAPFDWPFDRDRVLAYDPDIIQLRGQFALPWEAE